MEYVISYRIYSVWNSASKYYQSNQLNILFLCRQIKLDEVFPNGCLTTIKEHRGLIITVLNI